MTPYNVFIAFKEVESEVKNKGYRLPKNWNYYWNEKLNKTSQENLQTMSDYINTVGQDIDLYEYLRCGFQLFKSFDIKKILNPKIIELYIRKDKQKKRTSEPFNKGLLRSIKYVKNTYSYTGTLDDILSEYGNDKDCVLGDYIKNFISPGLVVLMIYYKYIELDNIDWSKIPYIKGNYNNLVKEIDCKKLYLKK